MKKIILLLILSAAVLAGCEKEPEKNASASNISTDAAVSSVSVTKAPSKTAAVTTRKEISPLKARESHSYFEDELFSVTAEVTKLKSSLYYADLVGEKFAAPDVFVIEAEVCAKNVSYSEADFDISKVTLSLSDGELTPYDKSAENARGIKSGKKEYFTLRFLCSLSKASDIQEFRYDNMKFEPAEYFISEEFSEALEIQADPDVKTYLYRPFVIHSRTGYYSIPASGPTGIEAHVIGRVGENGEYFAVEYMIYNRSDYALLIEPSAFNAVLYNANDETDFYSEELFISTDEELMYKPVKKDMEIKGIRDIYEIPEFICMNDEGETKFTMLYKAPAKIDRWLLSFAGSHGDEDHYVQFESVIALDCDI